MMTGCARIILMGLEMYLAIMIAVRITIVFLWLLSRKVNR